MRRVTVTMDDALLQRARMAAAREGKSLSKFVAESVKRRVGRSLTQSEALELFLSGPPLNLLDENGEAPSRDALYDD